MFCSFCSILNEAFSYSSLGHSSVPFQWNSPLTHNGPSRGAKNEMSHGKANLANHIMRFIFTTCRFAVFGFGKYFAGSMQTAVRAQNVMHRNCVTPKVYEKTMHRTMQ